MLTAIKFRGKKGPTQMMSNKMLKFSRLIIYIWLIRVQSDKDVVAYTDQDDVKPNLFSVRVYNDGTTVKANLRSGARRRRID